MKKLFQKLESKILTKLFMRWVDTEYDLETLAMTRTMIYNKEVEIKSIIDKVNHKPFKGFVNYEN